MVTRKATKLVTYYYVAQDYQGGSAHQVESSWWWPFFASKEWGRPKTGRPCGQHQPFMLKLASGIAGKFVRALEVGKSFPTISRFQRLLKCWDWYTPSITSSWESSLTFACSKSCIDQRSLRPIPIWWGACMPVRALNCFMQPLIPVSRFMIFVSTLINFATFKLTTLQKQAVLILVNNIIWRLPTFMRHPYGLWCWIVCSLIGTLQRSPFLFRVSLDAWFCLMWKNLFALYREVWRST